MCQETVGKAIWFAKLQKTGVIQVNEGKKTQWRRCKEKFKEVRVNKSLSVIRPISEPPPSSGTISVWYRGLPLLNNQTRCGAELQSVCIMDEICFAAFAPHSFHSLLQLWERATGRKAIKPQNRWVFHCCRTNRSTESEGINNSSHLLQLVVFGVLHHSCYGISFGSRYEIHRQEFNILTESTTNIKISCEPS